MNSRLECNDKTKRFPLWMVYSLHFIAIVFKKKKQKEEDNERKLCE